MVDTNGNQFEIPYIHKFNPTALPKWRQMEQKDAIEFGQWVEDGLNARWQIGMERYESHIKGFQGNPLDHAIEEALDQLLYLWIEKRRQQG
jgi:trimethylamine:corrinoid methyltransferase-like protein